MSTDIHVGLTTATALLIVAALATLGWVYTARRARILTRKQHSFNVLVKAIFDKDFSDVMKKVAPHLRKGDLPKFRDENDSDIKDALNFLLNYCELLAAGVRNGDLDERLIRDCQRGMIVTTYEVCASHIESLRTTRRRRGIYEHLEWLHSRWEEWPPRFPQRALEWFIGRPIQGRRKRVNP